MRVIPGTGSSVRQEGPMSTDRDSTPRLSWWPLAIGVLILAGLLLITLAS